MRDDMKQRKELAHQLPFWQEGKMPGEEQPPQPWQALLDGLLQAQPWLQPHAEVLHAWFTMLWTSYPEVLTGPRTKGKKKRWSLFRLDRPVSDEEAACYPHWPAAGLYDAEAGVGIAVDLPERPHHIQGSLLIDVIEKGPVSERYFLSPHAAHGMLRRADRMKRQLFPPLRSALEVLASRDQDEGNLSVFK
jgi:hypothetical protein